MRSPCLRQPSPRHGLGFALAVAVCGWASAAEAGRVVVIGVDGLSFDVVDPLIAGGELPNFARLVEGGGRAVLRSEEPMRSPALWTTIATGQPRDVHGIYDFVTGSGYWPVSLRQKERRLVTSDMRRARALWQYASQAGLDSLVVGWLNTWPAERIRGAMLAPYVALRQAKQTSIKGRIYADAEDQSWPPQVFATVRDRVVNAQDVPEPLVRRLVDPPAAGSRLFDAIPLLPRYLYAVRWSLASALTNVAILETLLRDATPDDLVMTYFDGADTLGHRFWAMRDPLPKLRQRLVAQGLDPALAPELKRRFGQAIDGYYRVFDTLLGRLLTAAGEDATFIIVSDHGWGSHAGQAAPHATVPFDGEHRLSGVWLASGPSIVPGRYPPLTLYDVAPTVLRLLGLSPPNALPGSVAEMMLDADQLPPLREVVAHEDAGRDRRRDRQRPAAKEAEFSETEIERLRSLGYVQ